MRRTKQILIMVLVFIFMLLLTNYSQAAKGSFSISKTSITLIEGKTTNFSITVSNCEGRFNISSSNPNVVKVSSSNEWIDGSTTITLTAVKQGNATITVTAYSVADTDENDVTGSKSISIKVQAKATPTPSQKPTPSTPSTKPTTTTTPTTKPTSTTSGNNNTPKPVEEPKTPTFKSVNKTVYTTGNVNLRSSWSTSSTATTVEKDTELKLTGTSSEVIDGYTWYRVTYNGKTMYVASSLITETKPKEDDKEDEKSSNKNLSSLKIEGVELTPTFKKETTNYNAKVDGDVTELKIEAKAEDSKAKVAIEGNKDLKEGDNIVKVKVTAENDTTRTYFITITKGEGTVTDTSLKLSELKIAKVNFEENFDPDVYTYELTLNDFVNKLDITATPNQADATVEITGNENFEQGKNVVTIILTSADGTKVVTYQIEVNLPVEAAARAESSPNYILYAIIGAGVVVVIIIIGTIIHHIKAVREEREEEEDNSSTKNEEYEDLDLDYRIRTSQKEDKKAILDEFLKSDGKPEDEDEKPRRTRGRHSR